MRLSELDEVKEISDMDEESKDEGDSPEYDGANEKEILD
jgi:hypothetical protein